MIACLAGRRADGAGPGLVGMTGSHIVLQTGTPVGTGRGQGAIFPKVAGKPKMVRASNAGLSTLAPRI